MKNRTLQQGVADEGQLPKNGHALQLGLVSDQLRAGQLRLYALATEVAELEYTRVELRQRPPVVRT